MIPTACLHRVAKGQWLEKCSVNLLHIVPTIACRRSNVPRSGVTRFRIWRCATLASPGPCGPTCDRRHISFANWEAIRVAADFSALYLHLDQQTVAAA